MVLISFCPFHHDACIMKDNIKFIFIQYLLPSSLFLIITQLSCHSLLISTTPFYYHPSLFLSNSCFLLPSLIFFFYFTIFHSLELLRHPFLPYCIWSFGIQFSYQQLSCNCLSLLLLFQHSTLNIVSSIIFTLLQHLILVSLCHYSLFYSTI